AYPASAMPNGGVAWVEGYVLLFAAVALLPTSSRPRAMWGLPALAMAGAVCTHPMPIAISLYVLGPGAALVLYCNRAQLLSLAAPAMLATAEAVLLALPFLTVMQHLSPAEQKSTLEFVSFQRADILRSPLLFNSIGPVLPIATAAGLLPLARTQRMVALAVAL